MYKFLRYVLYALAASLPRNSLAKQYGVSAAGEVQGLTNLGGQNSSKGSVLAGHKAVVPFKCIGTMLNCSSEDPCGTGSCTKTFHKCKQLGTGIFQQCGSSAGACQAASKCYMECRGTQLSGTACKEREVTTGTDCNNGFVKTGDLGMACTVDPDDSTRCIEKHPCALPL
eukprot:symbB.v1.2.022160.t1/scaffold1954.1/size95041/3